MLHYKQLPYTTVWLHGHQVRKALMAERFPPTWYYKGKGVYTIPAILDPPAHIGAEPSRIADSRLIAEYLEKAYPDTNRVLPTLPDQLLRHDAIIQQFETHVLPSMIRVILPSQKKLTDDLDAKLSELRHRPLYFGGKPYAEAFTDPEERKQIWDTMKHGMEILSSMIDSVALEYSGGEILSGSNNRGVYIFGREPTFADMVLLSHFCWARDVPIDRDPGLSSVWEAIRTWNGGRWERMLLAFERDHGCQYQKGATGISVPQEDNSSLNQAQARL